MKYLKNLIIFLFLGVTCDAYSSAFIRILKNRAFDIIDKAKVGKGECSTNLKSLITDLIDFKNSWALKMIDASAKLQTGILTGNIYQLGNFDQCLAIREDRGKYGTIEGQYCTGTLTPSKDFNSDYSHLLNAINFTEWVTGINIEDQHVQGILKYQKSTFGICLPKACSTDHLQRIWDYIEKRFKSPAHIHFSESLCSYKEKQTFPFAVDKYIFMFFGIIAVLLILSTMYDLLIHQYLEDKSSVNIWNSFSMYTNFKRIVTVSENRDSFLDCTAGIKTICMLAVVLGHKLSFMVILGNINSTDLLKWRFNYRNAIQLAIHYTVDTFLVLSGMLLSYQYVKNKETLLKGRSFPLFQFYFYRLLRLWPGLVALILFYIGILKYLNDGPFWPMTMYKAAPICAATGWATALFLTNFISFPFQCVEQSWYLAVDTQLYIISPIVLINLYKHPKTTAFVCTLLCSLSSGYVFLITYKYYYGHNVFESDRDYHDYVYQPTFIRMPPWFIGLFLGYFLHYYRQVSIPKGLNIFLWVLIAIIKIGLIFVHTAIARKGYNHFISAIYNASARTLWALATSVLVYLCATGHSGGLNKFLSKNVFQIATRISYSVYLVHVAFQAYISGGKRTFSYFNNFHLIHQYFADIFFIFALALLWNLAFEAPFINFAKLMFKNDLSRIEKIIKREKRRKQEKNEAQKKVLVDTKHLKKVE